MERRGNSKKMKVSKIVSEKGRGMVVKLLFGMLAYKLRGERKQPSRN